MFQSSPVKRSFFPTWFLFANLAFCYLNKLLFLGFLSLVGPFYTSQNAPCRPRDSSFICKNRFWRSANKLCFKLIGRFYILGKSLPYQGKRKPGNPNYLHNRHPFSLPKFRGTIPWLFKSFVVCSVTKAVIMWWCGWSENNLGPFYNTPFSHSQKWLWTLVSV